MRLPATVFCTAVLAMPSLAQGLPAAEGDGNQTQSVELLQGTASVTVQSSGSLSAGRGSSAAGNASLDINDVTVEIGNGPGSSAIEPNPNRKQPHRVTATVSNRIVGDNQAGLSSASGTGDIVHRDVACPMPLPTADDLNAALERTSELVLKQADCVHPADGVATLIASSAAATSTLASANVSSAKIVSITINQSAVTFGYHD